MNKFNYTYSMQKMNRVRFLLLATLMLAVQVLGIQSVRAANADSGEKYAQCYLPISNDAVKLDGNCKTTYTLYVGSTLETYTLTPPGGNFDDDYGSCYIVKLNDRVYEEKGCDELNKRSLLWEAPGGTPLPMFSVNWLARLSFKSPLAIKDSTTNVEYRTNSDIFGNGTSSYLNDGDNNAWYIYVPVGDDKKPLPNPAGKCLGVFAAELRDDGSGMFIKGIQPARSTDGTQCVYGSKPVLQGRTGSIGNSERLRMIDIGGGGEDTDGKIDGRSDQWRFFVAPFFWANKDSIKGFDTSKPEFKPLTGVELDNIKASWESTDASDLPEDARKAAGWAFFKSSDCKNETLIVSSTKKDLYIFRIKNSVESVIDAQTDGFSQCALGRNLEGGSTGLINAVGIPTSIAFSENAALAEADVDQTEFADSNNPTVEPDAAETPAPITCNTTWKSAMSWILCPIIGMAEELADKAKDVIASFLFIDINTFNGNSDADTGNDNGLYNAWNSIRQISTIIIVIIALIMIMSEAMGAGIMNNYSVKKILPKLIFAGIAIQLSWVFTKELINISNVFGNGVHGLMLAPFGGTVNTDLLTLIRPPDTDATSVGLSLALLVGGTVAIGAVGSAAMGLIIALVVAFVTLTLRYMVIILAVMFSPIAIAMSILPGTQKTYKLWWESFSKALLMYPIIMAMFAAGKIVAYGLMQSGTKVDANGTSQRGWFTLAAIIAYFLPYALLPAALKAGGTALNKVTGMFNDKSKGAFEKGRNYVKKRQEFNKKIKDNQLAIRAGGKGLFAATARMQVRSRNGQPITGLAITPSRRKAIDRTRLGLQQAAAEQGAKEADAQLQTSSDYNNTEALRDRALASKDASEVQAIVNRLATLKADGEIRQLMRTKGKPHITAAVTNAANTGKLAAAFSEKAGDIVKAKPQADGSYVLDTEGLQGTAAPDTLKWTKRTWAEALSLPPHDASKPAEVAAAKDKQRLAAKHFREMMETSPDAAASMDPEKKLVFEKALKDAEAAAGIAWVQPIYVKPATGPGSDIRLKRNISHVSTVQGIKLYSYQYLWSDQVYVGVMAQDLIESHPEALHKDMFGYYHVDYSKLGLQLMTYEEWIQSEAGLLNRQQEK